jgi:hypothetical protein
MRRTGFPLSGLLAVALLAACPLTSAQDFSYRPKSPTPDELPGKQLIVWSQTQKPHPLPASSTETYSVAASTQVLSGTIVARNSGLFFTEADCVFYGIANQNQISAFAGKKVRVTASLNTNTQMLRVLKIEELKIEELK